MKFIYPISSPFHPSNCQASWEIVVVEVEYLFMADGSQHPRQNTESNYDFRYINFDLLNIKPLLEITSGRYRENVVPE